MYDDDDDDDDDYYYYHYHYHYLVMISNVCIITSCRDVSFRSNKHAPCMMCVKMGKEILMQ